MQSCRWAPRNISHTTAPVRAEAAHGQGANAGNLEGATRPASTQGVKSLAMWLRAEKESCGTWMPGAFRHTASELG